MNIELLQPDRLSFWCSRINMPAGACQALEEVRADVTASPALSELFEAFYTSTAVRGEWDRDWHPLEPAGPVAEHFGQRASLFYLLAHMAAIPALEQHYLRLGIDVQIMLDTLRDIPFYLNQSSDVHGYWRFDQFMWIWRHLSGELFRLGRLQFMLQPFGQRVTALRRSADGKVLLLADPERVLRGDGNALGAGQSEEADAAGGGNDPWNPVYEENEAGWRGNPVSPYGSVLREPICLARGEWQAALQHGDTILDLHIPRGQSLTTEECRDSFRQAFDFFQHYYPERPFKGVYCHTWFFTPQLQSLLPPSSSIVRFQREFYLFPYPGGPGFLWNFVFGEKYPDRATAPRDTSLRRAVIDWLEAGKPLFDLCGVMLHEPELWGKQPYMSDWDKASI
jgi:hypothetical protein